MLANPKTLSTVLVVRILSADINEPLPIRIVGHDPIAELQRIIDEFNAPPPPTVEWIST